MHKQQITNPLDEPFGAPFSEYLAQKYPQSEGGKAAAAPENPLPAIQPGQYTAQLLARRSTYHIYQLSRNQGAHWHSPGAILDHCQINHPLGYSTFSKLGPNTATIHVNVD